MPIHISASGLTLISLDPEGIGYDGRVISLLSLLNAVDFLHIYYTEMTNCSQCQNKERLKKILKVPIVFEHIKHNSVQEYLDSYFQKKDLNCSKCKTENKSAKYILLNHPGFLILYFEKDKNKSYSDFSYDDQIYINTLEGKTNIKELTGKIYYKLIGSINAPSDKHFNCAVFNPRIYNNKLDGWYFHDGIKNNGNLVKVKSFKKIRQQKPFVLFYERIDLNKY